MAKKKPPPAPDLSYIAAPLRPLAVPLDALTPDPANARTHPEKNVEGIAGSLHVYGQVKPVVVRKDTGVVIAGNGTLAAARQLGWTHLAAVYVEMDAATAAGFSIADNRTAELAGWDAAALDKLLGSVTTGEDERLDAMLAELKQEQATGALPEPGAGGDDFDATPEPDGPTRTNVGELWVIGGTHRLLVGDCTDAGNVARLMGGERVGLCFTSPPYAQQRDYGAKIEDWDALMCGAFGCLPMQDDGQVLVNLGLIHREGEWVPYWDQWIEWMRGQGWRRFGWYVWDQGFGLPGDWNGRLAPSHEFIWHFNREPVQPEKWVDKKPENIKPRNQGESTMRGKDGITKPFTNPGASGQPTKIPDSIIRVCRQPGSDGHPAQFPVALPEFILQSWPGDVYDPFLGSGTTLIAAHRLGRRCYGCEIEPRYADVILKRAEAEGLAVQRE